MNLRVIVPMKYGSPLQQELFQALKEQNYTWSSGENLCHVPATLSKMCYLAINVARHCCSYSSNPKIIEKPLSECGMNYVVTTTNVSEIFNVISFLKEVLDEGTDEYEVKNLVRYHFDLRKIFIL